MQLKKQYKEKLISEIKLSFINSFVDLIDDNHLDITKTKQNEYIAYINDNMELLINGSNKFIKNEVGNVSKLIELYNSEILLLSVGKKTFTNTVREKQVLHYFLNQHYNLKPSDLVEYFYQHRTTFNHSIKCVKTLIYINDCETTTLYNLLKNINSKLY